MTTSQDAYLNAVRAAPAQTIARWRTGTCPECEEYKRTEGEHPDGHVIVNGAVVVGCQGYQVVSPAALGLDPGEWADWTDDAEDTATCPEHGQVNVMDWGSYSGFAGGACSWAQLSCGCYDVDESADLRAAR